MCSLLEEYRRRHKIASICPINEGVLFLNVNDAPRFICLTSSHTKACSTCDDCHNRSSTIILECFALREQHTLSNIKSMQFHCHMRPDNDILDQVRRYYSFELNETLTPYLAHSERDMERWLWNYFLNVYKPFGEEKSTNKNRWQRLLASQVRNKMSPDEALFEQIFIYANTYYESFSQFYNELYSVCMIGRKYILRS